MPIPIARFLGTWFGVLPLKATVTLSIKASKARAGYRTRNHVSGNSFLQTDISDEEIQSFNEEILASRDKLSLQSGSGSHILGGTCSSETSFDGTLLRLLEEIIPECVEKDGRVDYDDRDDSFTFDSILPFEAYKVVTCTRSEACQLCSQTSSLKGLLNHVENRGHPAAPFVEGLTVELLPFQSQSLQWALERETTPGGLQSFFWTKLPHVAQVNTDLYYHPILGKLSSTKPNLIRGGIIAEEQGLGKTVISLALILSNPAPATPVAGSPVASITPQPDLAPGSSFWDPDLYQRTSEGKPKRGNIVSRGTLVVVSICLAQWRRLSSLITRLCPFFF